MFNLDVADHSGEIRVTGFNELLDSVFNTVHVGRCYLISGGTLKSANRQYATNSHAYEITLNRGCEIVECEEPLGEASIPKHNFKFTKIAAIEQMADDQKVDLLAIIQQAEEAVNFTSKAGKEMTKRVLHLADDSGKTIETTIFGDCSTPLAANSLIALKAAKVGSWNTKSLTVWGDSGIMAHPDVPEGHELMGWWTNIGM